MAALILYLLTLLMAGRSSASWCVCKTGLSDSVLQRTLDYACGNGADCNPTHPKGSCFNPDNVRAHCNYAVNSFFQKKHQASDSCNFTGTATLTTTDPSYSGCAFPSSAGGSSGSSSSGSGGSSSSGSGGSSSSGSGGSSNSGSGGSSNSGSGGSSNSGSGGSSNSGSGGSSNSGSGGSSSSGTVTPGNSSPKGSSSITTFPGGKSPYTGTPTTGFLGGNVTDATGTGLNPDYSNESSGFSLHNSNSLLFISFCSLLMML